LIEQKAYLLLLCIRKNEHRSLMQIQKENIRNLIIAIARDEFVTHGFRDASMRRVADKSGVALSNIYNYFKSKDELFSEILQPVLTEIDGTLRKHNNEENLTLDYFSSDDYQRRDLVSMVTLVESYKIELNLLLFQSAGSSYENFREQITERNAEKGQEYLLKMKEKYPKISIDISPFFIHVMGSMWVNILAEVVSRSLSHDELTQFISEYIEFGTAGWQKLMKI